MAAIDTPITIKRYPHQRLYNPGAGSYVTLEDLANMVEDDEDFVVCDANGEDITRLVLRQIVRASHG